MSENLISLEQAESDVLAASAYLAQHMKSGDGHAEAMKAVVPRYLTRGEVDLAAELSNTIDDPFTRDRLLIHIAEKCAELGDDEYGLQLADAIEDMGMQSQARERVAIRKAMAGDYEKSSEIAEQIIHADYVYAEIAVGLAKAGREPESAETLNRIELPVAKVSAFQGIAAWNLENGNNDLAATALDEAVISAREIEHDVERIRTLGEIANSYTEAESNDLAIATYETAREEAEVLTTIHRDVFLSGIAIGLLRAGNLELADEALDLVADKTQMASGLLGFARLFWDSGDKDEAMEALEESYSIAKSQKESEIRDSRAANNLMGLIAAQFALFGRHERAIEIAQENRDDNERVSTLGRIAQIATLEGNDAVSQQSLRGIEDESNRIFGLIGVAEAHAKLDDYAKGVASLDEAVGLAADLPQPLMRASVFETVAPLYIQFGSSEKAHEACNDALENIATIRSDSERAIALAALSDIYSQSGKEPGDEEKEMIHAILRKTIW
jgi:tetratricopeptide (TPR) repeat protein